MLEHSAICLIVPPQTHCWLRNACPKPKRAFLILNENDNPFEVFKKINYIIENKENITNLFEEYLFNLNSSCNNKKAEFIYD